MIWGLFFGIVAVIMGVIAIGFCIFAIFCILRVGADSERRKLQISEGPKTNQLSNEVRIIKKFLIFPRKINNKCKWFKIVYILQAHKIFGYDGDMWFNVRWATEAEYETFSFSGAVKVTQQEIDQAWRDYCNI